ncbi:23S rRNA (guanosine-2'-O-)-methyltransferase RlmB [bioreactor metagenome]|uniref:23S rRNA (Guanosine-2'-O-)-methyltransferase RlmB n=1 Tax=bioreactor metagenome TaxID=1076179 RepID=A0A645FAM9_9ZZZZ
MLPYGLFYLVNCIYELNTANNLTDKVFNMNEIMKLPNALLSLTRALQKSKTRRSENLFLAEGKKVCSDLLNSNYKTKFVIINNDDIDKEIYKLIDGFCKKGVTVYETKNNVFESLCDAVSPQGIIGVVEQRKYAPTPNESFVALDNISDPGNVGTIIRTADWFGVKQMILIGDCADMYNPKVVRSSMGSIFRMKLINADNTINVFTKNFDKIEILAATLDAKLALTELNKKNKFGLIVGNETRGISLFLEDVITQKFIINGYGTAESLNVAIATGISLFHLIR